MKVGKFKLHIVNSGSFALDGGAMFGIIPKTLWQKSNPPDEKNRIPLVTRNLLLTSESKKILIDTGMGDKWDVRSKDIYRIDQSENSMENSLKSVGITAEEITDVIFTHLHFDHAGGGVKHENGKFVPAFPNAKYHVQKRNYEWAISPSERDSGSYIKKNFVPLMDEGVLNLIEGEKIFDDEIEFMIVNGHTFAQQILKISDSSNTILFCGDMFPTSSHVSLPYVMGYDLQPLVTVEEKKKILPVAIEENWKLFLEHDPYSAVITVKRTDKGFDTNEKSESL